MVAVPMVGYSESNACIDSVSGSASSLPNLLVITTTSSWVTSVLPSGGCGGDSTSFHSDAPECTATDSAVAVTGAYCSVVVTAGQILRCAWKLQSNSVPTKLYGGWDENLNGVIESPEKVFGPMDPLPGESQTSPQYFFTNPVGGNARMILFPTNTNVNGGGAGGDVSLVGCLVHV
jgi:hypothetical protein